MVQETKGVLIKYTTRHLSSSEKIRFHYALKGRNETQGVLTSLDVEHIGSALLLANVQVFEELKCFFECWGIPIRTRLVSWKGGWAGEVAQNPTTFK